MKRISLALLLLCNVAHADWSAGKLLRLTPTTDPPGAWASGQYGLWIDSANSNRLSLKNSDGTIAYLAAIAATTKGDLSVFGGTTWLRLGAGTNNQCLIADSTQTSGLRWGTCGAGGAMAIGGAVGASTTKSVLFVDNSGNLAQENTGTNFFIYDTSLHRLILQHDNLGISTDGALSLQNTSPSTNVLQQSSPQLRFVAHGWNGGDLQQRAAVYAGSVNGDPRTALVFSFDSGTGGIADNFYLLGSSTAAARGFHLVVENAASPTAPVINLDTSGAGLGSGDTLFNVAQNGSSQLSISGTGVVSLGELSLTLDAIFLDGSAQPVGAAGTGKLRYNNSTHIFEQSLNGGGWSALGNAGTVTSIVIGNGLASTQSPLTTTGTMSIDTSITVDKTTAQTLTNKTLTAPIINGATSASGNFDLSGSGGTTKTTTGACTFGGSSNTFTNSIATDASPAIKGATNTNTYVDLSTTTMVLRSNSLFISPFSDNGYLFGVPGSNRWATVASYWYDSKIGAQLTAAATITPTTSIHHVTGATTINVIAITNLPGNGNVWLTIIADSTVNFGSSAAAGGIKVAPAALTSGKAMTFVYDSATQLWYAVQGG